MSSLEQYVRRRGLQFGRINFIFGDVRMHPRQSADRGTQGRANYSMGKQECGASTRGCAATCSPELIWLQNPHTERDRSYEAWTRGEYTRGRCSLGASEFQARLIVVVRAPANPSQPESARGTRGAGDMTGKDAEPPGCYVPSTSSPNNTPTPISIASNGSARTRPPSPSAASASRYPSGVSR